MLKLQLQPYASNLGKRLIKSPKVFLSDTGIANALLRITDFEQLAGHPSFGSAWETLVFTNLSASLPQADFFFYRTSHGSEADLVIESGNKRIAVECKASRSPKLTAGTYNAIQDVNPMATLIVAPVDEGWPVKQGVTIVNIPEAIKTIRELWYL
jgi:predicted AAA+ superfamily ATPase